MGTGSSPSSTESVIEKMRALLDELDAQAHDAAAAYLAQAIAMIEGQAAADREKRV